VATNRWLPLDQIDVVAGIRQLQRRLQAGDATADDQRRRIHIHVTRLQRLLIFHTFGGRRNK
jgi:hypothetical protein